jgi:hypothetical protein
MGRAVSSLTHNLAVDVKFPINVKVGSFATKIDRKQRLLRGEP